MPVQAKGTLLACLTLLLAGCKLELPAIDGGSFEVHAMISGRDRVTTGPLTKPQIEALVSWLRAHDAGWNHRLEDTAPGLLVHLKHGDAPVVVVNIRENEVKVKDLFRAISPDERAVLLAMLEPTKAP